MCRLYGFTSAVTSSAHASLVEAKNALARQSAEHRDGWGIAYYVERYPHLVRSDKPALDDNLFTEVSAVVRTRCLVAHIRAATAGQVAVLNCHPFQHGAWTFAHNGKIGGFSASAAVQLRTEACIDERFRGAVLGATDSERIFYIFLSCLARRGEAVHSPAVSLAQTLAALRETITAVEACADPETGEPTLLNFLLSNGSLLVGYRQGKELYFSTCKTRCPERASCYAFDEQRCERVVHDGVVKHLIVSSEPVSANPHVWQVLGDGEYVAVHDDMQLAHGRLADATAAAS